MMGRGIAEPRLRLKACRRRGIAGVAVQHWVALDAVAGSRRKDGKPFLRLVDDALLPVSRSYADAVRKSGLL